jgi:hypothetical protein
MIPFNKKENTMIKSPQEVERMQQTYTNEVENLLLESLTQQFNTLIAQQPVGKSVYTIKMYMYRPAGFYTTSNVRARFIQRCNQSGWIVSSAVIDECQFTITVVPLR